MLRLLLILATTAGVAAVVEKCSSPNTCGGRQGTIKVYNGHNTPGSTMTADDCHAMLDGTSATESGVVGLIKCTEFFPNPWVKTFGFPNIVCVGYVDDDRAYENQGLAVCGLGCIGSWVPGCSQPCGSGTATRTYVVSHPKPLNVGASCRAGQPYDSPMSTTVVIDGAVVLNGWAPACNTQECSGEVIPFTFGKSHRIARNSFDLPPTGKKHRFDIPCVNLTGGVKQLLRFETTSATSKAELCSRLETRFNCTGWALELRCEEQPTATNYKLELLSGSGDVNGHLIETGTYSVVSNLDSGACGVMVLTATVAATPEDTPAQPDPNSTPDPNATPDPTATSEPTATSDPTATPDPTATSDPAATPDPTAATPAPEDTLAPPATPPLVATYQWFRSSDVLGSNPEPISEETNAAYTPTVNDIEKYVFVTVTFGAASVTINGQLIGAAAGCSTTGQYSGSAFSGRLHAQSTRLEARQRQRVIA